MVCVASYIVKRSNAQDLMLCYNVPFFNGGDVEGFLTSLARAGGRVRKVCSTALDPTPATLLGDP